MTDRQREPWRGPAALVLVALGCAPACGSGPSQGALSASGSSGASESSSSTAPPTTTIDPGTSAGPTSASTSTSTGSSGDSFPDTPDLPEFPDPPGGKIPETCAEAQEFESSIGCEFFAARLDNFVMNGTYAIVAANVQLAAPADVVVESYDGVTWTATAPPQQIAPLDLYEFELPGAEIDGSGIGPHAAYRLTASVPIAAYQINSYSAVASSDASLLLPTSAWDTLHRVASLERVDNDPFVWTSYFAVISATPDAALEIVVSDDLLPGPGVPAALADEMIQLPLGVADVAQVAVSTEGPRDPTGTRIDSGDVPVAVFGGTSCSIIVDKTDFGACDHLEEQLPGVRLWGQQFVAARAPVRSKSPTAESSLWQVVASDDDTTVQFAADPAVVGVPAAPVTLDAGQQTRFMVSGPAATPGDFTVSADKPILLLNYTLSGDELYEEFGNDSPGDPAMIILPPVEQYLPRYVVLVPSGWDPDVITIVRPKGTLVRLDDAPVDDGLFYAVGPTHEVARVVVADGTHRVEADQPVAVTVVGYRADDSYGYVGGIGTAPINPNPPK